MLLDRIVSDDLLSTAIMSKILGFTFNEVSVLTQGYFSSL